jgi:hypothetical protein
MRFPTWWLVSGSRQSMATWVWLAVRSVLLTLPSALASLNAAAYWVGQGGGRRAELGAAGHGVGRDEGDVRAGGRAEVRRGRLPLAGVGVRQRVRHDRAGTAVAPQGQDLSGNLLADGDACRARPEGMPARSSARAALKTACRAG